jgi:hypothetical protein
MAKKQTCLKSIYIKVKNNKRPVIESYEFDFPEIITEDLGFEMQFGFPEPKDPSRKYTIEEYEWPIKRSL